MVIRFMFMIRKVYYCFIVMVDMTTLANYTFPCTIGNMKELEKLEKKLDLVGASPEEVRDYFFQVHNPREYSKKNLVHMCVPYGMTSKTEAELYLPFFEMPDFYKQRKFSDHDIETARKRGVLDNVSEGDILVTHARILVDKVLSQDLKKYGSVYNRL